MSTMTIDEYNAVAQNSVVDIAGVMQASVASDASTVADSQLTPEARFEQVKNALYASLDKSSAYAKTQASDIATATGSKISEKYWTTVADSFDKWKLDTSTATSLDAVVDAYAKGAARTFQDVSKNAPAAVGLAAALTQSVNAIDNSNDVSAISDALGLMSMTVLGIAAAEALVVGLGLSFGVGLAIGLGIGLFATKVAWPDSANPFLDWVNSLWSDMYDKQISDLVNTDFSAGQIMLNPNDPLTFDLDGDGVETIAENGLDGVLFDHNADGVKTATSWVSPDDGFLVRDINGNGTIDSGRELFGDNTLLSDGTVAANGFEALADLDSNADGVIDVNDVAFGELRIWQDGNSDGITQMGELLTLEQASVASINTAYEETAIIQNGNIISGVGSYTKTDGTSSELGSAISLGNLDLVTSTFYSSFTNPVAIAPEADALPTMNGSGMVRDMDEAASLDPAFAAALTNYSALATREDQLAALDGLLLAWSDTSGLQTMIDRALEARYIPEFIFGNVVSSDSESVQLLGSSYDGMRFQVI